jgi:hypothetical protein
MTVRQLAFWTGTPAGVLLAATFSIHTSFSWLDVVLSGTVTGTAFGLTLAWLGSRCAAGCRRRPLPVILLLLLQGAVALATAGVLLWLGSFLPHGSWQLLPPLPEPAIALSGANCVDINQARLIAVAEDGTRYPFHGHAGVGGRWLSPDSAPHADEPRSSCWRQPADPVAPGAPGKVLATKLVTIQGADCGGTDRYALLADGTIWGWWVSSCSIFDAIWFIALVGGTSVIAMGSWLALVLTPSAWRPQPAFLVVAT